MQTWDLNLVLVQFTGTNGNAKAQGVLKGGLEHWIAKLCLYEQQHAL